jgi:hypothetical protein
MAKQTLTMNKLAMKGGPGSVNGTTKLVGSSDGLPMEVDCEDPGKLFFMVYDNSSQGSAMRVSSTGATGARSGMGDKVLLTTAQLAGSSDTFIVGPFEGSRFIDNSSGGKLIRITFYTTNGTTDPTTKGQWVAAFEICPSTDGIISTT